MAGFEVITEARVLPPGMELTVTLLNSKGVELRKGVYHRSSVVIRDIPFDERKTKDCPLTSRENDTVVVTANGYLPQTSTSVPICPQVLQKISMTLLPEKQ